MARFLGVLLIALFCASLHARNLVYIFDSPTNNTHLAILKGANSALADFNLRYGKDFKAVDAVAISGKLKQAQALKKISQDSENIGAVIIPSPQNLNLLQAQVAELAAKNFPIIVLENPLENSNALQTIFTDSNGIVKKFKEELGRKSDRIKFKIVAVIDGENEEFVDKDSALKSLSGLKKEAALALLQIAPVKFASSKHFSNFQKLHEADLLALDNYAVVFLSELPLNDTTLLNKDGDRLITISLGGSPYMANFIKNGQINLLAMPDYFGLGYVSAVALVEKNMENKNPKQKLRTLMPIFFSADELDKFNKVWILLN